MPRASSVLGLTLPFVLGGCLFVVAGAAAYGVVQYDENEASRSYRDEFEDVWHAGLTALERLGYPLPTIVRKTATEGALTSGDASLTFERIPEGKVRVAVRVGTFDTQEHRRRAALVLEQIADEL
jgi:hypothetical protein